MKQLGFHQENRLAMLSWIRITRFQQIGNHLSNEFLQPFCITVAQFDVLIQVFAHQPLSQQELAEYLSISLHERIRCQNPECGHQGPKRYQPDTEQMDLL